MTSKPVDQKRIFAETASFFDEKVNTHGATPEGLDFNSLRAQETRFDQLLKVVEPRSSFSVNDYGCGFGSLAFYMQKLGLSFSYAGYDISSAMISNAKSINPEGSGWLFTESIEDLKPADYTIANAIFNKRFGIADQEWTQHVIETLTSMARLSTRGFSFNMLTMYSDKDRMREDLYYGDPSFFFDYCKRNLSRNVALLHDYELYDFTIIVRLSK